MKNQLYFENEDDERCYTEDHFQQLMKDEGLTEIEVFKAVPEYKTEYFFCQVEKEIGEVGEGCGKVCGDYEPRNGKNGRCRHSHHLYTWGDKITLKLKS
jgi:hypothetical protein